MNRDLLFRDFPRLEPGWVWLAGAGPGDPAMLTLGAVNGLMQADAVVYDALVDERILAHANEAAELIYAGKRGGRPSPKQADISQRLIKLAKAGRKVLRLKGGDPFVFGRGGEEALALVAEKVPFRIIPGVSAGIGGLAYAGIPVTHRDINSSVTFITGHGVGGGLADNLDWDALAKSAPVLVIYMGLKHLEEIAKRLIAGGRDPNEVTAVIASASTPEQRVVETSLARAARDCADAGLKPPTLVVIGRVVDLRAGLDWLGALSGRELQANPLGAAPVSNAG